MGKSAILSLCLATVLLTACSPGFKAQKVEFSSGSSSSLKLEGTKLYAANCASCHGSISVSDRRGRTPTQILDAIKAVPSMSHLKDLILPHEADAISIALNADVNSCMITSNGTSVIRRLTTQELQNALVDLFGLNQNFTANLEADKSGDSGFQNSGKSLEIGYVQVGKIYTAVEAAVNSALNQTGTPLLTCAGGVQNAGCANSLLSSFARRAYRRDVTAEELNTINSVYLANAGLGFRGAIALALQKILMSPHFLFVTSFSGEATVSGKRLSDYEFATRLSLFLWNSIPDTQLLDLAANKTLRQPQILKAQISRMLKDPKADRFINNFFGQWLKFADVSDKVRIVRTGLTDALRADMLSETQMFLKNVVSQDLSLMTLVNADYTYLNGNLAAHYGIGGVTGTGFVKTSLTGSARRGILSHASILTVLSNGVESRPVARGKFLLDDILCESIGAPPANVNTGALDPVNLNGKTVREVMAIHAANPVCATCHSKMDPLGLSLENFNQIGKFRSTYTAGQPVDASGSVLNEQFRDFVQLNDILSRQTKVRSCLAKKVLTYAIWRMGEDNETCAAQDLGALAVQNSSTFSDLVYRVVTHDMFNFNVTDSR